MDTGSAISSLSALAQETRLAIFRMLVEAGAEGLAAGVIAERLAIPASSLSFHLTELHRAGLVAQRRESRSLIYSANYRAMSALVGYLTENCCGGNPAACAPLMSERRQPQARGAPHEAPARARRRR
ncbi:MAG TPA: metalloregulator ArsR/SmtB family transcription factor [Stellaceae bacterium]|jgi:ArsR family transcriptional regulator|nr:metalloregulator ArsR/SmtB family transcription factor [Stellaceae bacterium]